jgi:hypothetical protein
MAARRAGWIVGRPIGLRLLVPLALARAMPAKRGKGGRARADEGVAAWRPLSFAPKGQRADARHPMFLLDGRLRRPRRDRNHLSKLPEHRRHLFRSEYVTNEGVVGGRRCVGEQPDLRHEHHPLWAAETNDAKPISNRLRVRDFKRAPDDVGWIFPVAHDVGQTDGLEIPGIDHGEQVTITDLREQAREALRHVPEFCGERHPEFLLEALGLHVVGHRHQLPPMRHVHRVRAYPPTIRQAPSCRTPSVPDTPHAES